MEAAAGWVAAMLTGSVGTIVALIAIAGVGARMLLGRLSIRSGVRVVLGCFILFGAPVIAQALAHLITRTPSTTTSQGQAAMPPPIPTARTPDRDPYAGASLPM